MALLRALRRIGTHINDDTITDVQFKGYLHEWWWSKEGSVFQCLDLPKTKQLHALPRLKNDEKY